MAKGDSDLSQEKQQLRELYVVDFKEFMNIYLMGHVGGVMRAFFLPNLQLTKSLF